MPAPRRLRRFRLLELLSQPPLSGAHVGFEVQSLDDGQVIFSRNGDDLLNPASNTKLVTSAAALLRLGPEYRFTTDYLGDRAITGLRSSSTMSGTSTASRETRSRSSRSDSRSAGGWPRYPSRSG